MAQQWQKDLPEAQGSVLHPSPQEKELYRSEPFSVVGREGRLYQLRIQASWGDQCQNGSNTFHCRVQVVVVGTDRESEWASTEDTPQYIMDAVPPELLDLKRWNGCHPFGPWYYIKNTVHLAGDRDHWGLLKGERKQMLVRGNPDQPMWSLVIVDEKGEEVPLHSVKTLASGPKPDDVLELAWVPCWQVGEGKERQLDAARRCAVWGDATDEQLCSPDLATALKARLPGLLIEFRRMIEGLGFQW
jgi:hypothetical protein